MSAASRKGASFERLIADALNQHVDDRIDRRVKTGANDKGDIGGLRGPHLSCDGGICDCHLRRIVVECKNQNRMSLAEWVNEADLERGNDDALVGLVVHKRRGKGNPLDQYVTTTVRDLIALLTGARP